MRRSKGMILSILAYILSGRRKSHVVRSFLRWMIRRIGLYQGCLMPLSREVKMHCYRVLHMV